MAHSAGTGQIVTNSPQRREVATGNGPETRRRKECGVSRDTRRILPQPRVADDTVRLPSRAARNLLMSFRTRRRVIVVRDRSAARMPRPDRSP